MTYKNTEKQLPGILRFLIRLLQIILYIPIQIVFLPFAVIGFADGTYRRLMKSRKMGEPWIFGIDKSNNPRAAFESFLKECGLKMTGFTQFGEKLNIKPFYCIVEAEKL